MSSRRYDKPTLGLFALYVGLLVVNVVAASAGVLPLAVAFIIGLVAFNLSFTIWHECAHNTTASDRRIGTAIGWLTALLMVYPGYCYQRRLHLLHHKYQGDPDKDPVYPRVQCAPHVFLLNFVRLSVANPQPKHREARLTPTEQFADGASYAIIATILGVLFSQGLWLPVLAAWIAPRLLIAPIHAFYVCYLPHHPWGQEVYRTYRVVLRNPMTRYLTLYHSYHGLHHLWPTIPWHRYRETFHARRAELEARGVEILGDS